MHIGACLRSVVSHPGAPLHMIVYPDFPLPAHRDRDIHALGRTSTWIGAIIGKVMLVIALAVLIGMFAGAALGFVVVIALI